MESAEPLGAPVVADPVTAGALTSVRVTLDPQRGLRLTVLENACP